MILNLLLGFVIVVGLLLIKPRPLILGVIALAPIINLFWFVRIGSFSLIDFVIGAAFVSAALKTIGTGQWSRGRLFGTYLLALSAVLIPVWLLLSAGNGPEAAEFSFKMLVGLATYQVCLNCFEYQDRFTLLRAAVVAVILTVCIVLFQLATGYGTNYSRFTYITGFYSNEGNLTRIAVVGIIVALPFRGGSLVPNRYLAGGIMVMCLAILGLALSRNAILAAMAVVVVHFFLTRNVLIPALVTAAAVTLLSTSSVIESNVLNKVGKELRYLQGENVDERTLGSGRIGRWERTLDEFNEADLGAQAFGTGRTIGPHGQFFDLLRRAGVYGLLVIMFLYVRVTGVLVRQYWRDATDPLPFYGLLIITAFWTLCLAASPLYEFYWQVLIFAIVALLELKAGAPAAVAAPAPAMAPLRRLVAGTARHPHRVMARTTSTAPRQHLR